MKADITVFHPRDVQAPATRTEPKQFPIGIEYVIVNGTVVIDGGEHTGALPGADGELVGQFFSLSVRQKHSVDMSERLPLEDALNSLPPQWDDDPLPYIEDGAGGIGQESRHS